MYWAVEDLIGPFVERTKVCLGSLGATQPPTYLLLWSCCDVTTFLSVPVTKGNRKRAEKKEGLCYCLVKGFSGSWVFTLLETCTRTQSNVRLFPLHFNILLYHNTPNRPSKTPSFEHHLTKMDSYSLLFSTEHSDLSLRIAVQCANPCLQHL